MTSSVDAHAQKTLNRRLILPSVRLMASTAAKPKPIASSSSDTGNPVQQNAVNDALSALVNLGYARAEVWSILRALQDGEQDSGALIGAALKELGKKDR